MCLHLVRIASARFRRSLHNLSSIFDHFTISSYNQDYFPFFFKQLMNVFFLFNVLSSFESFHVLPSSSVGCRDELLKKQREKV